MYLQRSAVNYNQPWNEKKNRWRTTTTGSFEEAVAVLGFTTLIVRPVEVTIRTLFDKMWWNEVHNLLNQGKSFRKSNWRRSRGHLSYGKSERPSVRRTVQMSEVLNIAGGRHVTGCVWITTRRVLHGRLLTQEQVSSRGINWIYLITIGWGSSADSQNGNEEQLEHPLASGGRLPQEVLKKKNQYMRYFYLNKAGWTPPPPPLLKKEINNAKKGNK